MESSISLPELYAILGARRDDKHSDRKFAASMKGIDLDGAGSSNEESDFERVKREAQAELAGVSPESVEFGDLGLGVEEE